MSARKSRKGASAMTRSLTYTQAGDYLFPNLGLPEQP